MSLSTVLCLFACLLLSAVASAFAAEPDAKPAADAPLRVMTFNLRYATANDGDNHWNKRKAFLLATIKAFDPDLLGTQETLGSQRDYLAKELDGYEAIGVGRDDGKEQGEMTAIFFRKARFTKIDAGHFWLSEKPDQPGSKSWDTSLTRMCTWVTLRDNHVFAGRSGATDAAQGPVITWFNTHFDHRGDKAREESARLIRARAAANGFESPVLITGDFNTPQGSAPYRALFEPADGKASPVIDAYRAAHPQKAKDETTFHDFGKSFTSGRIDWIGVSRHWTVTRCDIDRTQKDGKYPSDHFPVVAELKWQTKTGSAR